MEKSPERPWETSAGTVIMAKNTLLKTLGSSRVTKNHQNAMVKPKATKITA
jgi:hypothetical protein